MFGQGFLFHAAHSQLMQPNAHTCRSSCLNLCDGDTQHPLAVNWQRCYKGNSFKRMHIKHYGQKSL